MSERVIGLREWAERVGACPGDYCNMEYGTMKPDERFEPTAAVEAAPQPGAGRMVKISATPEAERAGFESQNQYLDYTRGTDSWGRDVYKHSHIQVAWEAWQASADWRRAAPGLTNDERQELERLRLRSKALEDLVKHCWVHSGYPDCGYQQMDCDERKLYDEVKMLSDDDDSEQRPSEVPGLSDAEHQREFDCLRKEYNAITRMAKQFDEFRTVYDPECELPQLADQTPIRSEMYRLLLEELERDRQPHDQSGLREAGEMARGLLDWDLREPELLKRVLRTVLHLSE